MKCFTCHNKRHFEYWAERISITIPISILVLNVVLGILAKLILEQYLMFKTIAISVSFTLFAIGMIMGPLTLKYHYRHKCTGKDQEKWK